MSPDGPRLAALWTAAAAEPPTSAYRTAASGVGTRHGSVLVALRDDGSRHLLIPIDARHSLKEETDGQAVTLRRRVLEDATTRRTYAALGLVDDRLTDLFQALCVEVLARVEAAPEQAVQALRRTLGDWRSLLSGARRVLGPSELAGLFGELLVLRDLVASDPGAVTFWTGPSGSAQDFHRGTCALEVKTTTSPEGRTVRIHGTGQLDGGVGRLLLTWFRLRTDRGRSVPDLVEDVLVRCDDGDAFVRALADLGYRSSDAEIYRARVFEPVEQLTYEVGPGFPRITPPGLVDDAALAGIGTVHYDLDLDSDPASSARIDVDPVRAFLEHS
ncbi:PD-(D/E)XK motif protein [Pseudonocardia sp. ICBG162]|uniref:PD-(D/E)XK motif protein n=1 Tax=Pseudonocardia sp. ICBG162 TaxID=2846761 RepID=UPI001CF683D2|nr:PD-(D/E)XK motif protein [Pseudonocardia sp. ICBG162]